MRLTLFAALAASLAGCGGDNGVPFEDTVPVTGIATYQGKPLEGYRVYFSNLSNRSATGMTDAEGRFSLGTNNEGDGAPNGSHKVWLVYSPEFEAEPGREDYMPPPKVKLPAKFSRAETSGITVEVPESGLTDYKLELK